MFIAQHNEGGGTGGVTSQDVQLWDRIGWWKNCLGKKTIPQMFLVNKHDPSNVIGGFTKKHMFLFGEVIGYMIFFSGTKIFHKSLLDLGGWITSPENGLLRVKTKWHVVQVRKKKL